MKIIAFLLANWDSVLVVLAFLALIVVLIKRGETAVLNRILFGLVTKAEKEFGGGTGKLKLAAVSDWIYQRIPAVLKLLFSEKDIEKLIESALEEAKKAWGTNGNLAAYIDECYYLSITPQEAEKAATKLNDEPRTIAPGT
ncbi:hypothetical protein [uncultured Oscillibacter sp.]|uniref:hypothetical protein n=1 Tax=uncultured Oscillibacter sp. TaxID=876091 RepID=UPI0026282DD1|nr:hypothetical protein [uncultured Oscillibacter sp.]